MMIPWLLALLALVAAIAAVAGLDMIILQARCIRQLERGIQIRDEAIRQRDAEIARLRARKAIRFAVPTWPINEKTWRN